jgi:hypothetical protein
VERRTWTELEAYLGVGVCTPTRELVLGLDNDTDWVYGRAGVVTLNRGVEMYPFPFPEVLAEGVWWDEGVCWVGVLGEKKASVGNWIGWPCCTLSWKGATPV